MINKQRIGRNFAKAVNSYDLEAKAQRIIARKLHTLLLAQQTPQGGSLLEIGCGTGIFTRMLMCDLKPAKATLNDLSPAMASFISPYPDCNVRFFAGDAETARFPGKYNIIASSSTIQWFTDAAQFFSRLPGYLQQNGLIAISTFGPDNLKEIKTLTGNGLDYLPLERYKEIIAPSLTPLHISEELITVSFKSVADVLNHLKKTGVNGIEPSLNGKKSIYDLIARYKANYSTGEEVFLTYHPIYIIAQAKN